MKKRGTTAELSFPFKKLSTLSPQFPAAHRLFLIKNVCRNILTFRELELGACAFLAVFFPLFFTRITSQQARLF
jgi:hypothetical protein